jgi:hypothetical protein
MPPLPAARLLGLMLTAHSHATSAPCRARVTAQLSRMDCAPCLARGCTLVQTAGPHAAVGTEPLSIPKALHRCGALLRLTRGSRARRRRRRLAGCADHALRNAAAVLVGLQGRKGSRLISVGHSCRARQGHIGPGARQKAASGRKGLQSHLLHGLWGRWNSGTHVSDSPQTPAAAAKLGDPSCTPRASRAPQPWGRACQ